MVWRSACDCRRNSVLSFASKVMKHQNSKKSLRALKRAELLELLADAGIVWEQVPKYCTCGVWSKHVLVDVPVSS